MRFFLIHGAYGNPDENWFPWLMNELENQGHDVIVPEFPTPEGQKLDNWMNVFDDYFELMDNNSIFVGHSLGPAFILSVLEKINKKVKACFFVSPFLGKIGDPRFDDINETFVCKDFDWEKIKKNCDKFFIYFGDNDPYLDVKDAEKISKPLGVEIKLIKNGGHLNEAAGYTEFPELLDKIKEIL